MRLEFCNCSTDTMKSPTTSVFSRVSIWGAGLRPAKSAPPTRKSGGAGRPSKSGLPIGEGLGKTLPPIRDDFASFLNEKTNKYSH